MSVKANNVKTVKSNNRSLILNILRRSPTSRADIAKLTGLLKSSVTGITNELIAEGQIKEIGTDEVTLGRKPILLDIAADNRFAAGIILHRKEIKVCLTNLKSEILGVRACAIESFCSAAQIIDYCCNTLFELIKEKGFEKQKCIGIGISSPGPLDYKAGIILSPPKLDILKNTPIADEISKKTDMPVVLENNSVLLAMRENILQSEFKNFMSVIISNGIGSAVVSGGKIYRGFGGFSGEIGHISIKAGGRECPCGNRGCLERYVSLSAVKEKFGFESYRAVADAAAEGDAKALKVIDYIAEHLGCGLVTAVNLFDLDAVILHGDYSYRARLLNQRIEEYINEHSLISNAHSVRVLTPTDRPEKSDGNSTAAILERYFAQEI